jgi:hypothetical protein
VRNKKDGLPSAIGAPSFVQLWDIGRFRQDALKQGRMLARWFQVYDVLTDEVDLGCCQPVIIFSPFV